MTKQKDKQPSLTWCIIFDAIGMLSYLIPAWAETIDIIWAPISAVIFFIMFGGRVGTLGAVLNFLEEIIPFTDFIPTFTIAWFIRRGELRRQSLDILPPKN